MTAQTRSDIVGLLERHGLTPRKSYGQHFLADPNLVQKIVSVAGVNKGDRVIEIGAGTGALPDGVPSPSPAICSCDWS